MNEHMCSKKWLCIIFISFVIVSCSVNRFPPDENISHRGFYSTEIAAKDSLYSFEIDKDVYIESLYSKIEALNITIDSLKSEIEFTSSRIFINDEFEIPYKYSFAGVEFDLTNDRIRNKLQNIYNSEIRRAHQFIPRSGIYFDFFESVFKKYDIHPDVKYLAVAESNLNYMAYSQASAAGIWQFIPSTARLYNLTINSYLDERLNIFKATDAACRYLIQAHQQLKNLGVDDWLVTLASYNAGIGGISRTIREQQGRDFFSLIMRVEETNNYIWRAIATKMIFEYEALIFDEIFERMPPLLETAQIKMVQVNGYYDLAEWAIAQGTTASIIWELNPWINISRTRSGRYSRINHLIIPPGSYEILVPLDAIPDTAKIAEVERKFLVRSNAPFITGDSTQHRVQRGETLSGIARRYNVRVDDIRRWNNISGDRIIAGQILHLQANQASSQSSAPATSSASNAASSDAKRYTVQSGDTIGNIARKLGVSQTHLMNINGLQAVVRNGMEVVLIRPGQVLVY